MPRVSPDGKWIVFAGQRNEGQAYDQKDNVLWLTDGSAAHTLETPPLPARTPAWSPDGKRIAFASDRGNGEGRYALFAINRDGSGLVQVTDYGLDAIQPVFSVDGQHMVYMEGRPGGPNGIAVIDLP
jgi:Tol biopolymer transport system component